MSFELAIQRALYDALSADPALLALGASAFDDVPQDDEKQVQNVAFPYVTIGEAAHADWSTSTDSGVLATAIIHTWSRTPGRAETKRLQGAIYDALHRATLTVAGYQCLACDFISSESFIDTDGKTRHGVQQFKILLSEI